MVKFLVNLLLLGAVFSAGYYVGQRPGEVKQTLQTLSENVVEKTLGLDQNLILRREILEAKARMVQAKSELLDLAYQEAARELEASLQHLKKAVQVEPDSLRASRLGGLITKLQEAQQTLRDGTSVPRMTLDEAQRDLDTWLSR